MAHEHVLVPAMLGLDIVDAQAVALAARVVTVTEDPDTPPPLTGTVVDQSPPAGTQVRPGDSVTIWIEDTGGGGGGSAPRSPDPDRSSPLAPNPDPDPAAHTGR